MHFETKSAKVVEDEVHATFKVFSQSEWECAVADIQALENFVGSEFLRRVHVWCVNADFSVDQVIVAGCHDFEDGNVLFSPGGLKGFSECCHEKEE